MFSVTSISKFGLLESMKDPLKVSLADLLKFSAQENQFPLHHCLRSVIVRSVILKIMGRTTVTLETTTVLSSTFSLSRQDHALWEPSGKEGGPRWEHGLRL